MNITTRILIVEDDVSDYDLAQHEIRKALKNCEIRRVETRKEYLNALKNFEPDLIVSDYSLPTFDGRQALMLAKARAPFTPLIIWTGSISEDVAVECMKTGAANYVLKENTKRLAPAVVHALEERELLIEHNRTLVELRTSERELRTVTEDMTELICRFKPDGTLTYVNKAYCDYFAKSREELIGTSFVPIAVSDFPQKLLEYLKSFSPEHPIDTFEQYDVLSDGRKRWCEWVDRGIFDGHGQLIEVQSTGRDITEHKEAEEKLRTSESRYRLATQATKDVIWEWDTAANQLLWTENAQFVFGYSSEEIGPDAGWWDEHIHPEDRERVTSKLSAITATVAGESDWSDEYRFLLKDGSYAYINDHAYIERDPAGRTIRMIGAMSNITERKRAEKELAKNEKRFRALIENGMDSISLLSADGTLVWENPATIRNLGYEANQFMGRNIFELMHPDDLGWTSDLFAKLVREPGKAQHGTFRLKHHNGSWRWLEATATNMLEEPSVKAIVINYRDITRRREAEEALRVSESKYRTLAENSLQGIAIYQGQKIVYANPAMSQINGYSVEELMDMSAEQIVALTHPDDRAIAQERAAKRMAGEPLPPGFEGRILRKDGTTVWLHSFNNPIEFDGKPALLSTMIDITQRKQAERERQALLEIMQGLANTRNLREFLELVHHLLGNVIYAENFFVVLYQQESKLYEEIYSVDQYDPPAPPSRLEKSITSYVFRSGEPLLLTQESFDQLLEQGEIELVGTDSASWLGVPLKTSNGTIGVMAVQDYQNPNRYSEQDQDFLASVASQVALAIERKQAETELQQKNDDLGLLNAINEAVVRGQDLDSIVRLLSDELRRIFSTVGSTIYMLSSDKRSITMQQYSFSAEIAARIEKLLGFNIPKIQIPLKEGGHFHRAMIAKQGAISTDPEEIQGWIAEFVETKFLPSIAKVAVRRLIPRIYKLLNIKSTIIVPLLSQDDVLGFLDVSSSNILTIRELQRISSIGEQLSSLMQRQQANERIRKSEEFLQGVQNSLSAHIAILDDTGNIAQVNSAWREFGGRNGLQSADSCIGMNYLDVCKATTGPDIEVARKVADAIRDVLSGEKQEASVEYACHGPQEKRWFTTHITCFDDGEQKWVILAHENITTRMIAETSLKEKTAQFLTLFEASPDAIMLIDPQGDWPIVDCNSAACKMNGYTREELIGKSVDILNSGPATADNRSVYMEKLQEAEVFRYETTHIHKDGTVFPIEVSTSLIQIGDRTLVLGIDRDITERKEAEEELRQSENRYRTVVENQTEFIVRWRADGIRTFANEAYCTYFGISPEQALRTNFMSLVHEEDHPAVEQKASRLLSGRSTVETDTHRVIKPDGTIGWNEWTDHAIYDNNGQLVEIQSVGRDITERRRMEEAEREQRILAEALRDTSQVLSSSLDYGEVLDHILTAVSSVVPHDAATIMLIDGGVAHVVRSQGYQKRDPNTGVMEVRLPLTETTNLRQMLETKQPVVVYDTHSFPGWKRMSTTDWLRSNVGAPISIYGEVIGFILLDSETPDFFTPVHAERLEAFANQAALAIQNADLLKQAREEIAERKRVEESLQAEREKVQNYLDIAGVIMLALDQQGTVTLINQKGCEILGYSAEEVMGRNWINTFLPEPAREEMQAIFQKLISGEAELVDYYENTVVTRNGVERLIAWHNTVVHDTHGKIISSLSSGEDITERRQAEQELRASEERFRQLATNIEEAFWMTDAKTSQEIYISPAAATIWGHSVEEMLHTPDAFIHSVLPADHAHVLAALERQKNGEKTEIEYRVRRPDGSIRWVWDRAFPIFDAGGRVKTLAGIAADITERKLAQERLRASEERYHSLFQHLVDGFALHEIITDDKGQPVDYRFLEINPAFEKLTGLRAETTVGRRVNEILPRVGNERFISIYGKVALTGEPIHFEEYSAPLGRYYEVNAYSPRHGQFAITFEDISERKQAEANLRKLSRAVEQSASTIVITDIAGNIEYVNPKFTEITGYSFEEAIGQNPRILKSGHTASEEYQQLWSTITAGEEWRGELYNRKKNGDLFWEQATISPIQNEQGEITHFIAVKEDITQRKQSEAEIQRHLVELQAVYENGLAVGQLLEPRQIGERLIETFARHLSWHHVTIRLLRPESNLLELIAFNLPDLNNNDKSEMEERFKRLVYKVGQGMSGWVVQTGTSLRTGQVHTHPQYVSTQAGIQSGLYMPLKIGDRVIGVISVESETPDAFSEQDERLLATLATQAAIAFENARLYQAAQQEIAERERAQAALRESEAHYRELADSITEIMFELDQNLLYTHWNKASEKFSGIPAQDVIGRSMQDLFGNSEEQSYRETIYRRVLTEQQAQTFETEIFPQGQRRILEINAYPSAHGVSVVARDITERRLSEALQQKRIALMEYSAHHALDDLMQRAVDEVSELTDSHIGFLHFVETDQKAIHMQAWSSETLQAMDGIEEKEMHYPVESAGVWADAVRQRRPVIHNDYEALPNKKGLPVGHVRVIRELVVPIIRDDRVTGVLGIGNRPRSYDEHDVEITERFADYAWDIIERKQMESALSEERNQLAKRVDERTADLSRANSNLARALRVKDEFLANMSHELRTPLNAILGLSESLSEQVAGPLNEKQQKYLNTINESGHHLLSLINDILDLAKIEAGQITLDINKVDINSVSQASLRMIKQLAQKKNQEVLFEMDDGLGLMWADERRLKQMMVNLLSNAVKFTPENGRLGLEVHGDQAGNRVLITVWDKGIGISNQDLDRLFKPFVQLDSGLAREATGTGLGLALVAQMARLHGGSVTVDSRMGEGSRFTIQLPWEPALAADMNSRLRTTGKFRAVDIHAKNKPSILLIEDTREVVMMLADYLEMAGFTIATAQDGIDGLEQAKLTHPDLILMDIQMPRMDGFETTQKLRLLPEFKDTPIIALTALAMPNDRQRCLDAGMSEYISKPVNLKMLLKLIRGILYEKEGNPR